MGLYGFKKQFWPMIVDGSKEQTIRCPRRWPDAPGDTMHLYGNLRQPGCFLLMRARCVAVLPVVLEPNRVELAGVKLHRDQRDLLAWQDGFRPDGSTIDQPGGAFGLMADFWRASQLPLEASMYYWLVYSRRKSK